MNLGRYYLGESVFLTVLCTDQNRAPQVPDQAPVVCVYDPAGVKILSALSPIIDRYGQTGLFAYRLSLGTGRTLGHYRVLFHYLIGGLAFARESNFEVVDGGHVNGALVALYYYRRPQATYIVQLAEDGTRYFGRGPTV